MEVLPRRSSGSAWIGGSQSCPGRLGWFFGPHSNKYLCHVSEVVVDSALLETGDIGLQFDHSDAVYKYLEIRDGVGDSREV